MKYNELTARKKKPSSRVGRGISAGGGKTAGRGTKGQGARKSGGVRPGFEGGQIPLYMRLPKLRGFRSVRPKAETVYTGQIEGLKKSVVTANDLAQKGFISSPYANAKLVVKGQLDTKKEVRLPSASQKAVEMIEAAGGTFVKVAQIKRPGRQNDKAAE